MTEGSTPSTVSNPKTDPMELGTPKSTLYSELPMLTIDLNVETSAFISMVPSPSPLAIICLLISFLSSFNLYAPVQY